MTGRTSGWLTVVRRAPSERKRKHGTYACWVCRCTCGQEIIERGQNIRNGKRKACATNGHYWSQQKRGGLTTKYKSEYASWHSMHERCENPEQKGYENYGGRGIKVCPQWSSFEQFVRDMGPKPVGGYSIDRWPDNNGNYEPSNCRWATASEQRRNARDNLYVEYEGKRMLLADLLEQLGLNRPVVYGRMKLGWSLSDALALPVRRKAKNGRGGQKIALMKIMSVRTQWDLD